MASKLLKTSPKLQRGSHSQALFVRGTVTGAGLVIQLLPVGKRNCEGPSKANSAKPPRRLAQPPGRQAFGELLTGSSSGVPRAIRYLSPEPLPQGAGLRLAEPPLSQGRVEL